MSRPDASRDDEFAYLLQVFPKFSETFILNELLEHQTQGRSPRVLSLRLPREGRFHGCLAELARGGEYVAESIWESPRKLGEAGWGAARSSASGFARACMSGLRRGVSLRDVWQAMLVRRWAERRGVRHVHVHFGGYAARVAYLARLMGGPSYSATLHAFDIFRDDVDKSLLRRIIKRAAFCVTVSHFNARYLHAELGDSAAANIRVLYNGIPLTRFKFSDAPREPGTILSVGRLIEKKGFLHLIRACRLLANRGLLKRCSIVGEGPQRDALAGEIKRLNLGNLAKLAGAWPQERIATELTRTQVFALPCIAASDGNMDALPTVLLEAMASGCPVVSTRLSGIPEIIDDGAAGLLVEPGNDAALADAMAALLTDSRRASALAQAGRRRAESHFDIRQSVSTLGAWLNAAARGETAAASTGAAQASMPREPHPVEALLVRVESEVRA